MNLNTAITQMEQFNERQLQTSLVAPNVEPTEGQREIWRLFEAHARKKGVRSFPASPALCADFLCTVAVEYLAETCEAIEVIHDSVSVANPIATNVVRVILERRMRLIFPESWNKADRRIFVAAPPELREVILKRELQRDKALRIAQNKLAYEHKRLKQNGSK
jgi:hypothetical protein